MVLQNQGVEPGIVGGAIIKVTKRTWFRLMFKTLKGFQLFFWVTMGTWNRYFCSQCDQEAFVSDESLVASKLVIRYASH